jgi:acetylornithine/N-succinyldiaminopimelate aminotransferase
MEEIAKPGFLSTVVQNGLHMTAQLELLVHKHGLGGVRGKGLLLALDLKRPIANAVTDLAFSKRLLINGPRPDTLRFMPALNVTQDEINQMVETLDEVMLLTQ